MYWYVHRIDEHIGYANGAYQRIKRILVACIYLGTTGGPQFSVYCSTDINDFASTSSRHVKGVS